MNWLRWLAICAQALFWRAYGHEVMVRMWPVNGRMQMVKMRHARDFSKDETRRLILAGYEVMP